MARVTNGSDAQLSGKLNDRVYVKYFDTTYVRKRPVVNKDARTPAQLMNQQRFKSINLFYKQFKNTIIPRIWKDAAVNTTGYRLFLSAIAPAFARDGSMSDYKRIKLTTGDLPLPLELVAQREEAKDSTIRVSWKQDLHFCGERLRDELKVIAQSNGVFSEITGTGLLRRSCGGIFELPVNFEASTHLYLFFVSNDQRDYSDSCAFAV